VAMPGCPMKELIDPRFTMLAPAAWGSIAFDEGSEWWVLCSDPCLDSHVIPYATR
jgi:hypothetical protein